MKNLRPFIAVGLLFLFTAPVAGAANITSTQSGNWNAGTTWVGGISPVAGDNVTIASSHTITVTMNAAATTITIAANTSGTNGITINSGILLDVSGAITMTAPTTASTSTISVGAGTLQAASIAIPGSGTASRICEVTVSTGTITTTGSITFSGSAARALFTSTGASTVNVAGNFGSGGILTTSSTGTFNFNGGAAQTIGTYTTYNNVSINNTSGGVTTTGTTTIGGTFIITTGTFTVGAHTLTVTGTTSVSGTLSISSTTGTKTFDNITVNNAGLINFTAAEGITCNGNLQVDGTGTITGTSGTWTFQRTGGGGTISGTASSITLGAATFTTSYTVSIPCTSSGTLTVTGTTLTNNTTLTVGNNLSGTGGLTQGTGATLHIGGASSITTLTATVNPNTVDYNGNGAQTVKVTTYHNLTVTSTGGTVTVNNITINNNFTIESGTVNSGSTVNTVAGNLAVNGGSFTTDSLTVAGTTSVSGTMSIANGGGGAYVTLVGAVTVNAGGVWSGSQDVTMQGGLTHNGATFNGTGTYTFATNNQSIGGSSAITMDNITVTGVTLTNNSAAGLTVTTTLNGPGELIQGTGATLNIGGTSGITTLTAPANPNTVNYTSNGNQTVKPVTYHHLTLSGTTNTKTLTNVGTINGDLTLSGSCSATMAMTTTIGGNLTVGSGNTLTTGSFTHDIKGNFTNNGTLTTTGSTITLTGTADQSIGGSTTTTFNHLTINKASGTVTVSTTFNVGGVLTFTRGNIGTGANAVVIMSTGSVSRTNGHVVGNLRKNVATGANVSRTFEIGDANNYAPVDVVFTSVSLAGNFTVSTTVGDHANIATSDVNPVKSVNRYWTMTNNSVTFTNYNATFNFISGDVDAGANTANFIVRRFSGGTWSSTTVGTRTSTSIQITGATAVGDFQVGNVLSVAVSNSVFAFGTQLLNTWLAAQSSVITNDGTETETIVAQISTLVSGANSWALSAVSNGADQVRAQWSTTSDTGPWTDVSAYATNFTISSSLAASGTVTLYFRIQTPTSTSSNNQYSSNLTVTAQ